MMRLRTVVGTLAALGGGFAAAESDGTTFFTAPGSGNQPTPMRPETRAVVIQGMVDADYVYQDNYRSGNDAYDDQTDDGWLRTEFGVHIELADRIEIGTTFAYAGTAGQDHGAGTTVTTRRGEVVLDDGYLLLDGFFKPEIDVRIGRQPVQSGLPESKGQFLYDSSANNADITSWDGARLWYNGLDNVLLTGDAFFLPDDSSLYAAEFVWQPTTGIDNEVEIIGSVNLEHKAVANTAGTLRADRLMTYYGGVYASLSDGWEFSLQGAFQDGDNAQGYEFDGMAYSGRIDYYPYNSNEFRIGVQYDYFSGDDTPGDTTVSNFIANYESISDTLIFEHEKYGELSELLVGNVQSGKMNLTWDIGNKGLYSFDLTAAYYDLADPVAGQEQHLGEEVDVALTWAYDDAATFTLFGGLFMPDDGFRDIAPVGSAQAGTDDIWLFGINFNVLY